MKYESILYLPPKGITSFESDPVFLLYVHGGPHSYSTLLYSYAMLILLYSGFAVYRLIIVEVLVFLNLLLNVYLVILVIWMLKIVLMHIIIFVKIL